MAKISIIVPAYNVENYITKCVDSLIHQTYQDIEIIIVDDGSKDRTGYLCDTYLNDVRINVIHKINEGPSAARNTGISASTGEYIMFIDGDDWIDEDTCEKVAKIATKNNADLVIWSYIREYENLSFPKIIFDKMLIYNSKTEIESLFKRIIGLVGIELKKPENADALSTVCCKMYKRDIIIKNNIGFISTKEVGPTEDLLFNVSIMSYINSAVYLNEYFYHYRRTNKASLTTIFKDQLFTQLLESYSYIERHLKTFNLNKEFNHALNNRICFSTVGIGLNEISSCNSRSLIQRIRYLDNILSSIKYRNAFKDFSLKRLPFKWKIFFLCAKYRITPLLYLQLLILNVLRKQN